MAATQRGFGRVGLRRRGVSTRLRLRWEWRCLYPGPGDLMFAPIDSGPAGNLVNNALAGALPEMDPARGILDIAFFDERGNSLIGPTGIGPDNIFATGTWFEELKAIAEGCRDVWFQGAAGETMYLEPA